MSEDLEVFIDKHKLLCEWDEFADKIPVIHIDYIRKFFSAWMTGHVRVPVELIENTLAAVREELNKAHNEAYPVCCGMAGPECCGSPEPEWPPHAMAIMDALGPIEKELSVMLNASKESV